MSSNSQIILKNVGMVYPHKVCFEGFFVHVFEGRRIALIGDNGSGKSTLLKIIQGIIEPSEGKVTCSPDVRFGYVPQIIEDFDDSSGAEKFNQALTRTLTQHPNILCLDEPTNHLDLQNKHSLMRMLKHYSGTLIVISHDVELLGAIPDEIWSIENEKVNIFKGNYKNYLSEQEILSVQRLKGLVFLKKEKTKAHQAIQFEQERQAFSRRANLHENDRSLKGALKEKASRTSGRNQGRLKEVKKRLDQSLDRYCLPEENFPRFELKGFSGINRDVVSIKEGKCAYLEGYFILKDVTLQIGSRERIAIFGDNGSGKSTLIKAILRDPHIKNEGIWIAPQRQEIGYLDQYYGMLDPNLSAYDLIKKAAPNWQREEIRKHLNDFLFRKNEEVFMPTLNLSGGEKARLSLALIGIISPKLLILDEVTNNLDLKQKTYVMEVLKSYHGALLIISHDLNFLKNIMLDKAYEIRKGKIQFVSSLAILDKY